MDRRTSIALCVAALAACGVAVAHAAAYFVIAPDPHARAAVLDQTGHASLGPLPLVLFVVGLIALVRFGAVTSGGGASTSNFGVLMGRLALVQVVGFLFIEMLERATQGLGVIQLLSEPVLWIGICLQLAVAAVGAVLLATSTMLARKLRARRRFSVVRTIHPVSFGVAMPIVETAGAAIKRGPPRAP